jgi:hypothetical protein
MIESLVTVEDPTESKGSPETTGFALVDCDADGRKNHVRRCVIVREGYEQRPIGTDMQLGCFYFPGLEPGRYCIRLIEGYRDLPKDEDGFLQTEDYYYSLPPWNVREVIFEVKRGAPVYIGKLVVRARKGGITIKRMRKSEGVWVERSPKHEKKVWEGFLKRFPQSLWAEPVQERLAELREM